MMERRIRLTPDEVAHFVEFIQKTTRGMMPGDPDMIALGTHGRDDETKE